MFNHTFHNIKFVKAQKPKGKYFFWVIVLLTILSGFYMSYFKIHSLHSYEGIYVCEEECLLKTILPLEEIKNFKDNQMLFIEQKKYPLKVLEFGEIEANYTVAYQSVSMIVPKLSYYEQQTINFQIITKEESLLTILLKAMKGGDA